MKYVKKILINLFIVCFIVSCGQKSQNVFLEKDGQLYEVADQVSFYYPKDFVIDQNNDNKENLQFVRDQEILNYSTLKDDTDNKVEDMPQLYAGQLEEDGAQDVFYFSTQLDSGIECYEFTGLYTATGLKFKHMIYFTAEAEYIYIYQAPQDVYDENIAIMSQYLSSLTVHHQISSSLD